MSVSLTIAVALPAVSVAWPAVAGAATAAAAALGFSTVDTVTKQKVVDKTRVDINIDNSDAVTENMAVGEEMVFAKEDIQVVFYRSVAGKYGVRVEGENKSKQQLREIGEQLACKITQQYIYHRLTSQLKNRNFSVVEETVENDGTLKMHVRTFQ